MGDSSGGSGATYGLTPRAAGESRRKKVDRHLTRRTIGEGTEGGRWSSGEHRFFPEKNTINSAVWDLISHRLWRFKSAISGQKGSIRS